MPQAHISPCRNVIGAATLAVADELRAAVEGAAGSEGSLAAAVVTLGHYPNGAVIEVLAQSLGVSHSRAVRVVDELNRTGLARRGSDPDDGRAVRVALTAAGARTRGRVLTQRARALDRCLGGLDAGKLAELDELASAVLSRLAVSRQTARRLCRLCDAQACGYREGRCPVTLAADRAECMVSDAGADAPA